VRFEVVQAATQPEIMRYLAVIDVDLGLRVREPDPLQFRLTAAPHHEFARRQLSGQSD